VCGAEDLLAGETFKLLVDDLDTQVGFSSTAQAVCVLVAVCVLCRDWLGGERPSSCY
jgi:hypothetical protein